MNHTIKHRAASGTRQSSATTDHIAKELNRYDEHLRDVRGFAAGTRKHCIRIVGRLLHQKFAKRPIEIAKLRPDDVREFLASQLDACQTPCHASKLTSALRSYLRYRTICGDQIGAVLAAIQNPAHWSLATLPRALTLEESERVLASFQPPVGGRNAATPSCAAPWTWDCVPVRSPTSRSMTSTGAPALSR